MRRKDREQSEEFALKLLENCDYASLATADGKGNPYCVPVSPVLTGRTIYFHCAREGHKVDNIRANDNVCISCVGQTSLMPEIFSVKYESAVGFGVCSQVTDEQEKRDALFAISEKYAGDNMANFEAEMTKSFKATAVFKIELSTVTGKAHR